MFGLFSPGRSPPAEADEEDAAHRKWDVLHSRLLSLEELWLLPPSEVKRRGEGEGGGVLKFLIITFFQKIQKNNESVLSLAVGYHLL